MARTAREQAAFDHGMECGAELRVLRVPSPEYSDVKQAWLDGYDAARAARRERFNRQWLADHGYA